MRILRWCHFLAYIISNKAILAHKNHSLFTVNHSVDQGDSLNRRRFITLTILLSLAVISIQANPFSDFWAHKAYQQADYQKSASYYKKQVQNDYQDLEALYNLGASAYQLKDYAQAQQCFEKVGTAATLPTKRRAEAYFNAANSSVRLQDYEKALAQYQQTMKFDPKDQRAKTNYEKLKQFLEQQKQQKQDPPKNPEQQKQDQDQSCDKPGDSKNSAGNGEQKQDQASDSQRSSGNNQKTQHANGQQSNEHNSQGQKDSGDSQKKSGKNSNSNGSNQHTAADREQGQKQQAGDHKGQQQGADQGGHEQREAAQRDAHQKGGSMANGGNHQAQASQTGNDAKEQHVTHAPEKNESTGLAKKQPEHTMDPQLQQLLAAAQDSDRAANREIMRYQLNQQGAGQDQDEINNW